MRNKLNGILRGWRGRYSGTVLVRWGNEAPISFVDGYAHRGFEIRNAMDTLFDTASVTKVFTAAAIVQLVERGLLRLEDRIADVIDLAGTKIHRDVRIEHLLTHTSGIADDADEESGEDYAALFVDKPNYSIRECRDFLPQFAHKAPYFAAGTNVRYNNCAFVLLGLAIEEVAGIGYREYIAEHIFRAHNMTRSHFCAMDEVYANVAEGYVCEADDRWRKNIYSYPPIGTADGGAHTTVGDLERFLRAAAQNETLNRPHCAHSRPHKYGIWRTGYGFEFVEDGNGDVLCMYKEGVNVGVEAMCAYYPAQDATVCLLSNVNGRLFGLHSEIEEMLISGATEWWGG